MPTFEGLWRYTVSLVEDPPVDFRTLFSCWAEDFDHAAEQAENAYPNCIIVSIDKEN